MAKGIVKNIIALCLTIAYAMVLRQSTNVTASPPLDTLTMKFKTAISGRRLSGWFYPSKLKEKRR